MWHVDNNSNKGMHEPCFAGGTLYLYKYISHPNNLCSRYKYMYIIFCFSTHFHCRKKGRKKPRHLFHWRFQGHLYTSARRISFPFPMEMYYFLFLIKNINVESRGGYTRPSSTLIYYVEWKRHAEKADEIAHWDFFLLYMYVLYTQHECVGGWWLKHLL